jgi:hypothetical protein
MAAVNHPDPAAATCRGAPARQAAASARRAALFASGLQRSDAPTATMAAEAITATVRRFGIHGCVSRMAQEFGDHPDAAAERMRWICQLAAFAGAMADEVGLEFGDDGQDLQEHAAEGVVPVVDRAAEREPVAAGRQPQDPPHARQRRPQHRRHRRPVQRQQAHRVPVPGTRHHPAPLPAGARPRLTLPVRPAAHPEGLCDTLLLRS